VLHWLIVAHVDPLEAVDTSPLLHRPKVTRPIPRAVAEAVEDHFDKDIAKYVVYTDSGFVQCNWCFAPRHLWDPVQQFAYFLAEKEGAVVMDEHHRILWPVTARQAQQKTWENLA
jgi:hypothetical protein